MFASFNSTVARAVVGTAGMAFCAGLCLVGATAPAQAAEAVRTTTVRYADLDLANPEGRATLDHRIYAAARTVCVDGTGADAAMNQARCIHHAVTVARTKAAAAQGRSAAL